MPLPQLYPQRAGLRLRRRQGRRGAGTSGRTRSGAGAAHTNCCGPADFVRTSLNWNWIGKIKSNPRYVRPQIQVRNEFRLLFFASYILQIWLGYPHEFPRRAGEVPDPPSKVQTSPDKESFDKALTKEVFAVAARDCTQTFLEKFDK